VPQRAKVLEFAATVDRSGSFAATGGEPVHRNADIDAEHLLLAALVRCSLTSLRYHARRVGANALGSGTARGTVTKRQSDGRYAFVEIQAELEVEIEPPPDDLRALLKRTERDCFIAASLTAVPDYRWTVNGSPL
jgi:uncharacterized OsmC-like protein